MLQTRVISKNDDVKPNQKHLAIKKVTAKNLKAILKKM